MSRYKHSRREFIKMAGLVSAGLSTTGASLFNLRNLGAVAAGNNSLLKGDYQALVCLYFDGGADSFQMLVPMSTEGYAEYANTRSNLALGFDTLRPIAPMNVGGIPYGLHQSMDGMQNLFNQGRLCFINNVGTLVNPINKEQFYNEEVPVPVGLFSHSDQTNQWHTASTQQRLIKGWAGRMSDMLMDINTNANISMNISFDGTNTFQSSNNNVEYAVNENGATGLYEYNGMYNYSPERTKAIDRIFGANYNDPFKDSYKKTFRNSLDASVEFKTAIDSVPEFTTQFSNNYLSRNFKMIAKIISAREKLGFSKQIFFLRYGGWDTHDELLDSQYYLLDEVDNAITEFHQVLEEINMLNNVVTFSMSEFGRTLTSNGNGTDHAWGGNSFVMGGPVNGNQFFGTYPSLALDGNLEIGGGVLIPTTPNDLYFAELALWFGVPPSELNTILPNINSFYSPGGSAPLGFLKI